MKNNFEINYFISDSSLYTPESLAALNESCYFITRVPEVTLEAKATIKKAADADKINIDSNYSFVEYNSNYGDCAQRWCVIHSKEAAEKALNKYIQSELRVQDIIPQNAEESARLVESGIKGIKYKDQLSRGKEGGTRNFVLFDPSIATITGRN